MADKHLTDNLKGNYFSSERKDMKFLKGFTLIALLPLWAGYAFALYNGDNNNLSNYPSCFLFSLTRLQICNNLWEFFIKLPEFHNQKTTCIDSNRNPYEADFD